MDWLKLIVEYHDEWLSIVRSFGEKTYSEDLVQETYLRLHRSKSLDKVIVNGKPNRAFMYVALRNNYITFVREKSKAHKVSIDKIKRLPAHDEISEIYIANDRLENRIKKEISQWHWYDRELFTLYLSTGKSMRKLSAETNISLSSIANTIKNCKAKLREKFSEDFEDYKNKDYSKL